MGVNGSDVYVPLPATVLVLVEAAAPAHVASSGPKRVKVMVPVGLVPPARMAVSVT